MTLPRLVGMDIMEYTLPLTHAWSTARGDVRVRRGCVVMIETDNHRHGFGEASPLMGFSPETYAQAHHALTQASETLVGHALPDTLETLGALMEALALKATPSARYATEQALLDLMAQHAGCAVAQYLRPQAASNAAVWRVPVNASIGAVDAVRTAELATQAVAAGFGTLKIKVGRGSLSDDLERLRCVRRAIGHAIALRVDANGAWSVEQAASFMKEAAPLGLEYVEQPVATLSGLSELRTRVAVPIAADESARTEADIQALLEAEAADVVVLKPALIGGLVSTLEMAYRAQAHGLAVVVTTLVEGAVGRAGALHVAAALGPATRASGLATGGLLARDICSRPLEHRQGTMVVPDLPGAGVVPDLLMQARNTAARAPLPLVHRARYMPDQTAVVAPEGELTYRALLTQVDRCAEQLRRTGLAPGDRIGLWASNSLSLLVAIHAIQRLGAVQVALHPRWTATEAQAAAHKARVRAVVVDAETASKALVREPDSAGVVSAAHASGFGGEGVAMLSLASLVQLGGDAEGVEEGSRAAGAQGVSGVDGHGIGLERAFVGLRRDVALSDAAAVVFSSGTTGEPKAIVLTYGNMMFSATGSAIQLGHLPSDRWLAVLPLCHVAGLSIVMRCALLGTTVVVHPAFDAPRVAEAIRDGACTLVSLVPTMLRRLLEEPLEPRAGRFRTVLLGGGFIAPELLASCRERGLPVAPTYGMTEASSQIATAPPGTAVADAGFPLVWTQVEVRSGVEVVEPGADGELWVRGPTVTPGTLDAAGTLEPRRGAWLATGDFVRETDLGRLQVVDRRTDRIVSGGENVHPSEVEAVLEAHAHVARACVVGLPDPEWGHRVVAAVTLADGSGLPELTSRLLVEHCRAQLAPYKVPKTVVVFEDLPRSALGKLNRREVRARLLARGQDDKQRSTQGLS